MATITQYFRTITFDFSGKGSFAGSFQIEVDASGVPVLPLNYESLSGDVVNDVQYQNDGALTFENTGVSTGICSNFSSATENTTYTENAPSGTWCYTLSTILGNNIRADVRSVEDGSISPSGNVFVEVGDDQTFTITTNKGYKISSVLVDGIEAKQDLVNNTYTFTNVNTDHEIVAYFEASETYDILIGYSDITKNWNELIARMNAFDWGETYYVSNSLDSETHIGTITIYETNVFPKQIFTNNSAFDSFVLPECFTTIDDGAFTGNTNMTTITFPSTITNFGTLVFNGCTSLGKIIVNNPTPPTIDGGDLGVDDVEVDVPYGSGEAYQNAEGWSDQNINDPKPPVPPTKNYGFNLSGMKNVDYARQGVVILRN